MIEGRRTKELSESCVIDVPALQREGPESREWSRTEIRPVDRLLAWEANSQRMNSCECGELQRALERQRVPGEGMAQVQCERLEADEHVEHRGQHRHAWMVFTMQCD